MLFLFTGINANAQLTGTIAVPAGNYPSIKAVVDSLNAYGVGTGGVTFNIAAAYTETAPVGGYKLTATGTAANPIIIQKDPVSSGANPEITSYVGTSALDGIFFLLGSDYVIIDGINLKESAANTTATTQMEWGFALLNKQATAPYDGCNNNTIKNSSITLNRSNTVSKGIYMNHHTATSGAVITPLTAVGDANSNNKFYGIKIQNAWSGIYMVGYDDPNYLLRDMNNDIGGNSYATADTITGLGVGASTVATATHGVYMLNQMNPSVSYTYIDNALGGVAGTSTVYGIYASTSTGQSLNNHITLRNNSIYITESAGTAGSYCANIANYDGNITITGNDIKILGTGVTSGSQFGIYTTHSANAIGTATFTFKNNTAQNFTLNNSSGLVYLFYLSSINQAIQDVGFNTITNITRPAATTGSLYGFSCSTSSLGLGIPGSVTNFYNNTITNVSVSNTGTGILYAIQSVGNQTCNYYNNVIDNLTCSTGQTAMMGIFQNGGGDINIYNNTISNISNTRDLNGIYCAQVTRSHNIYNNKVFNLTSAGSGNNVYGIQLFNFGSDGAKVYNNKIYGLTETAAGVSTAQGIYIANGASGVLGVYVPLYIYNNIIGNIKANLSAATATPGVIGINVGSASTNTFAAFIRYNNVYLNDTCGANAHSAALYHNYTASKITLNNNLFVNNTYHAAGTGNACGVMRNGTVLTSYEVASGNNLIYAGLPSSRNLVYFDNTNKDSVWTTFKSRVSPREMTSFTHNITMFNALSTPPVTAASANYLQNDTTVAGYVEGGALNIAGITTDIRGVIRQGNPGYTGTGTRPDIGAFESQGTGINMVFDSVIVTKDNSNAIVNYTNQPVVNIQVNVSGNANGLNATQLVLNTSGSTNVANMSKARLYYSGSSPSFSTATPFGSVINSPNGTMTFTGTQAMVNGANNFWLAYDIAPTAVVGNIVDANVVNVVVGGVTKTPLYGNPTGSKTIVSPVTGTITVGTGPYLTLASIVNALNANGIAGNVNVELGSGFTETAPAGGYVLGSKMLNSTLNANNKLVFRKTGAGTNPLLTAQTGASTTLDGIFTIQGCDYVTIDGIDLVDLNTVSATTQMEWGYGLLKMNTLAPYDGCQNIVIKNSVVTLNIANAASKGIYANNHIATDATALTLSDISETNSFNTFIANTIQNANTGISLSGYGISTSLSASSLYDKNVVIGDSANGNKIYNFGGATAGFGVNVTNQANARISYNTIDNAMNGVAALGAQTGIQHTYTYSSGPNAVGVKITNNDVILTLAQAATAAMQNIVLQNSHGNVIIENNNVKWVTAGTGTTAGAYWGIAYNPTSGGSYLADNLSFKGNTAKNFSFASSGSGSNIIFNIVGAALTEDLSYDSIYNITRVPGAAAYTATFNLFYNFATSNPGANSIETMVRNMHHNYIVNVNNGSSSTGGITVMNLGQTYNLNVYNNRISTIVNGAAGNTVYGMLLSSTLQNSKIYNNVIDTLTGGTGATYGISISNATGVSTSVYNNSISNLSATGTGASVASAIYFTSGGRNVNVYSNKIYNITTLATGAAYASAIHYTNIGSTAYQLTPLKIYNNIIGGINAPSATSATSVMGIVIGYSTSTTQPYAQLYNNTISLSGTTASNIHSAGIYTINVSTGMLKVSNNIVLNNITSSGTGIATALYRVGTSLAAFDPTSNNNIYWAGTPSATHLIYYDGTNKDQTIYAYKARVYPRESGSETENVAMIATVGTDANFLYPDSTVATSVSNNALVIPGVTSDYNNKTRSLTVPDIGAFEGNFTTADITAPSISISPLTNAGLSAPSITFTATIRDVSGVSSVASGNGARVYYKKTGGSYVNTVGTLVSGTATNGTWSFTINPLTLGSWSLGDTISYYVAAQDVLSNTGSAPFGAVGSNVTSIATDPAPYKFVIVNGMSGNYTVCASGCDYSSLTNTGGAFESINSSALTGNVTLKIAGDLLNESGLTAINAISRTGNYSLSIVPNDATDKVIAGSIGSSAGIINFNGCSNVIIDGRFAGSGKYLRIRNRNTAGCTIRLLNDSKRDTVRYVNIEGNTSTIGTVYFNTPAVGGTGNDSNAIMYCDIRDTLGNGINASTTVMAVQNTAFYSDGNWNSENTISNNNFYNYIYQGVNFGQGLGGHDNWVIDQNSFYQQPAVQAKSGNASSATQAIYIGSGQGHKITNNSIGGSAPDRSGAASKGLYITGSAISYQGIVLLTGIGLDQQTIISGNKISNIDANPTQNTSPFTGIVVQSGNVSVTNNIIGGAAAPYDTIKDGSYSVTYAGGIVLAGGVINVTGNTVGNIYNYSANNSPGLTLIRTIGISVPGGATSPYIFTIQNNTIRDIRSNYNYVASSGFQHNLNPQGSSPVGIFVNAGTSVPVNIDGNTIYNITNTSTLAQSNQAHGITIKGGVCNVQRNRIYNINTTSSGSASNAGGIYGIYVLSTSPQGQVIKNNQISLIPNSTSETGVFGIVDGSTTPNPTNIYNNSVYIGGTASGNSNSYALLTGAPSSLSSNDIKNNILYNARTGGSGTHYAASAYYTPSLINASSFGYNLMITPSVNTVMELPAGTALNAAAVNAMYTTNSSNTNWIETSANVSATALFTNTATGNLALNSANTASWYANGKGLPMTDLANDYNNATRSTTIAAGSTDIGSVEVTPSVAPASATASAVPSLNGTTTYTYGNRAVASVTWGAAGTVPTALDVKYYSGTNAPSLLAGKTQYNAYYAITPTGGTGYTYSIALAYDSAVMGNVLKTAESKMAYYKSPSWTTLASSSANAVSGMLSSGIALASTTLPANFTGTNVNNALPVKLVKFSGIAVKENVELGWTTVTEINNAGFDVERSVDGEIFEAVRFVKGAGNSSTMQQYALTDNNAFKQAGSNTLYYRLKQSDLDGRITYSEVITVSTGEEKITDVSVYPNPTADQFTISAMVATPGTMDITIMDLQGKVVAHTTKETVKGMNAVTIDPSMLNGSGIYFVKVTIGVETKVLKLMKQ